MIGLDLHNLPRVSVFLSVEAIVFALTLVACVPDVEVEPLTDDEPPGYCEEHEDCAETDRCVVSQELDSHLQEPGKEVREINRCWPRALEGDFCTELADCVIGLRCKMGHCVDPKKL